MNDNPPSDLVPVTPTKDVSDKDKAASLTPPTDLVPVKMASMPTKAKRNTYGTVLENIPNDIAQDVSAGLHTENKALKNHASMFSGPEALLGAAEVAGAPVTGTVRALAEPFKSVFPQDTTWGKMAYNTIYDAGVVFGPSAVGEVATAIKTAPSAVRELMDSGVNLTIGQISGKFAKRFEEAAKSVPVLGTFIRNAEGRTFDSWNVATINKIIAPAGKVSAKDAREAATKAEDIVDAKYDQVRMGIPSLHLDKELGQDIIHLQTKIGELPVGLQDQFDAILNNRLHSKFGIVGAMDGTAFKKVDSELRTVADGLRASQDNAQRDLGHAVTDLRIAMRDALRRQYPKVADQLAEVDRMFGMLADVQRAGTYSPTAAGQFTPGQFLQSLKRSDRSARDKDFFKGLRPMQEWAEKAQSVIGNKMPDSGSAERLLTDLGGGAIGGGAAHLFDPTGTVIPGVIGGSALYSGPGQAATNAVVRVAPDIRSAAAQTSAVAAPAATIANQLGLQ